MAAVCQDGEQVQDRAPVQGGSGGRTGSAVVLELANGRYAPYARRLFRRISEFRLTYPI